MNPIPMKKIILTLTFCFGLALLNGCATHSASHDSSRMRTAYVVPAPANVSSQMVGLNWPLSPVIDP